MIVNREIGGSSPPGVARSFWRASTTPLGPAGPPTSHFAPTQAPRTDPPASSLGPAVTFDYLCVRRTARKRNDTALISFSGQRKDVSTVEIFAVVYLGEPRFSAPLFL